MSYRAKGKTKYFAMPVSLGVSCLIAWVITIVFGAIVTFMVSGERVPLDFVDLAAVIILCVSSFVCAMVAGGMIDQKRMIGCVASGAVYYLSLICINLLFFEGCFQGLLGAALTIMGSCVLAGFIQTRQKTQRIAHFKAGRNL